MNCASWIRIIKTQGLIGLLKKSSRGLVNFPPQGIPHSRAGQGFSTVGSVGVKVAPCSLQPCCCCLSGQHPKVQRETLVLLAQSQGLS